MTYVNRSFHTYEIVKILTIGDGDVMVFQQYKCLLFTTFLRMFPHANLIHSFIYLTVKTHRKNASKCLISL